MDENAVLDSVDLNYSRGRCAKVCAPIGPSPGPHYFIVVPITEIVKLAPILNGLPANVQPNKEAMDILLRHPRRFEAPERALLVFGSSRTNLVGDEILRVHYPQVRWTEVTDEQRQAFEYYYHGGHLLFTVAEFLRKHPAPRPMPKALATIYVRNSILPSQRLLGEEAGRTAQEWWTLVDD